MKRDQGAIGDLVCSILEEIYVRERRRFERAARQGGISLQQLAAAPIAEAVGEELDGKADESEEIPAREP